MTFRPATLPDFESPPVVEVVLGVQFDRIADFQTIHAGRLWEIFRADFPLVQEQAPLPTSVETFGTKPETNSLTLELVSGPQPFPRLWFLRNDQTQLVQFQPDKFIHNWRKTNFDENYPRYENIKSLFQKEITKLNEYFLSQDLGNININQCEVTYVNHIVSEEGENIIRNPQDVVKFIKKEIAPNALGEAEYTRFELGFILSSESERPIGRVRVSAQPAISSDGRPMVALTLTVRGTPSDPSLDAASNFLDIARDKIVRSFAELTTEKMHKRWGRKQ